MDPFLISLLKVLAPQLLELSWESLESLGGGVESVQNGAFMFLRWDRTRRRLSVFYVTMEK